MISKFVDNLWRPRRSKHHRRSKQAPTPIAATEKLEDRTLLSGQDLIAFAQALTAANVTLYGAAWDANTTEQKSLLEDGASFLQFVDMTNADRTLNANAVAVGITEGNVRPIWRLDDGTLIEGNTITTLQELSTATGVDIPMSDGPYLKEIADQDLISGTSLHVALDGYDPDNGVLTYDNDDLVSSNPAINVRVLEGNRSLRISVAGYGDMVFELFEGRASRATDKIIALAEIGFFDSSEFHRIFNGFLRGGLNNTFGDLPEDVAGYFDDQFHNELQHVQSGLLTMYKPPIALDMAMVTDDINFSQFVVTNGASRNYDFQNTIFGYLVEGEEVRDALSKVPVTGALEDFPEFTVTMETVDVFTDHENATLVITAAEGYIGSSTISVTVRDQDGNTQLRQFQVNATNDEISDDLDVKNAKPYLGDIPDLQSRPGETIQYQLVGYDADLDASNGNSEIKYYSQSLLPASSLPASVPSGMTYTVNEDTGLLTVTTSAGMTRGVYFITVAVGYGHNSPLFIEDVLTEFVDYQVVTIIVSNPALANDDFFAIQGDTAELDIIQNDRTHAGALLLKDMEDELIEGYSVEIVAQPTQGGTVTVDPANGKVSFVSNGSTYVGLDKFTYRIKDDLGAYSETATVNFSMAPEGVILVTTLDDNTSGDIYATLREAIQAANNDAPQDAAPAGDGPDTIMFDPKLFMNEGSSNLVARTIYQKGTEFEITDSVTIIAPTSENGDPLLTIDATTEFGVSSSRHFYIDDGEITSLLVSIQNVILIEGNEEDNGGSIYNAEHLILSNSELRNNQSISGLGGAIFNTGTLEITDSVLQSNTAVGSNGGAIASNFGSVTLTQSTIDDNEAYSTGGGIYAMNADITLINSVVSQNMVSEGSGGGVYQIQGLLTVTGSTFLGNQTGTSSASGGGVYATETTTSITDSTFHDNRSVTSGGGLIQNLGVLSVRNSTFSENQAQFGSGGGIYTSANTVSVLNSTISGNTASQNGGGIFFFDEVNFSSGTIDHSTIAANHATMDGGGFNAQSITIITANNTIIADNTAGNGTDDGVGNLNGSYSLIENTNGLDLSASTNYITGQDPGLLPLADNGGLTQTHALSSGSIAIDAGDPAFDPNTFTPALTLDQNGSARVADGNNDTVSLVDIGAYEAESVLGTTDLTVKWRATSTGPSGEVGSLPLNVDFIDEWNPVIVEIWVSVTNSSENGVTSALVDFSFDAQYLIADSIEYGSGFSESQTGIINNETGMITGLGAATSQLEHGADTLVLLARVRLSAKPVPLNAVGQHIQPVADLNFQIFNSTLFSSLGAATVTEGAAVNLTLVPALYDLDDNGSIGFGDLVLLINVYGKYTGDAQAPGAWGADFDHSGQVNFRDLTLFVSNYNNVQGNNSFLSYPSNFNEIWQQDNLITSLSNPEETNSQTLTLDAVTPVLDAAKEQLVETQGDSVSEELADVKIEIVELSGNQIAKANTETNTIYLDANAAGWGWFVDSTPFSNEEYNETAFGIFDASLFSAAGSQIDLLTVLLHELNHLLGHNHEHESGLMEPVLNPGERKLSSHIESDDFFSGYLDSEFDGIN
ncbi:peptidylprolyl isomerase [uncultured Gimesia sp.]|uniref:peptidylprolyl isomerase n=1 Tax=uncultured Gimesia sp. TaxID=1678688 RepID=UPI0030DC5B26|tara:strand:+ start:10842 stop:15560 length:4719 start_codon:yes stop_codon:yes gene_type:complete